MPSARTACAKWSTPARNVSGGFCPTADQYQPERVNFDKELLRRFYLKNGFADFSVTNASAELSPDRKSFFLTFIMHEGERYKVGKTSVVSHLRNLNGSELTDLLELSPGDYL